MDLISSSVSHLSQNYASAWNLISIVSLSFFALYLVSFLTYIAPILFLSFLKPQDLREKYGQWAVVTGGSSGIGLAIVRLLASQGVNVFIVALDDELLADKHKELCEEFPDIEFRAIGVNLGDADGDYMQEVIQQTEGVDVSILVNNAGFLVMGFFHEQPIEKYIATLNCNAIAAIRLTHHFYSRMVSKKHKGCIMFTSSAAWFLPAPFATTYGASKALLTHFAGSLAIEAQEHGIDVTVFHPSYTHSNLYEKTPKLDVVTFLSKFGWTGDEVAKRMFACIGRVAVHEIGFYAISTNLLSRFLDSGSLVKCIIPFRDSMAPQKPESEDAEGKKVR
ncbi:short chain dehydrogenase [Gracilaria domingensis]|nr:short chain dehydrogenase [Gracilaria domingensis]